MRAAGDRTERRSSWWTDSRPRPPDPPSRSRSNTGACSSGACGSRRTCTRSCIVPGTGDPCFTPSPRVSVLLSKRQRRGKRPICRGVRRGPWVDPGRPGRRRCSVRVVAATVSAHPFGGTARTFRTDPMVPDPDPALSPGGAGHDLADRFDQVAVAAGDDRADAGGDDDGLETVHPPKRSERVRKAREDGAAVRAPSSELRSGARVRPGRGFRRVSPRPAAGSASHPRCRGRAGPCRRAPAATRRHGRAVTSPQGPAPCGRRRRR